MNYNELFTFENLYQAHLCARKTKMHKPDVVEFDFNSSGYLWDLFEKLNNRTYNVAGYNKFCIYEPKKREIQALRYYDRIVQHCLCDNYLYPLLTNRFIYDNGACQKGKGTSFAYKRLTKFLSDYYKHYGNSGYILKADVRHYFPSVDHDILKERLSKPVGDGDILNLLYNIIDSFENEPGKGLPMGNQTSQLFALYYLDPIDRLIKEKYRMKYYTRYMDDMVIIFNDKTALKELLAEMKIEARDKLKLEFNEKTQICPIKNGVEYLGFRFYLTESGKVVQKLKKQKKKQLRRRFKKIPEQYSRGEITIEDYKQTLAGVNGHLKQGNTYGFRRSLISNIAFKQPDSQPVEKT